ncbi:MAG TPA: VWA domain-containing protein [Terracidiphilus sp.]|jgi:VWFA-related protein|nr:VWA domain-containing protein [Terracidiphilus sp.]
MIRTKTLFGCLKVCAALFLLQAAMPRPSAQDETSRFHVNVVLVQLNVAVTDGKGNYITGLHPDDFVVTEDNIPEKIATFEVGEEFAHKVGTTNPADPPLTPDAKVPAGPAEASAPVADAAEPSHTLAGTTLPGMGGANVFILFDTSNYMYRSFVFAQDAIADFIRTMPEASRIAFYSYSRDLSRASALTADRFRVVSGVRSTVAGDDAALYNSLLLTVKDAAPLQGRKAIVVFSNGPDNASSVPPEDVAELAQSTGTLIYIVSTREAESEPVSSAAFERMSKATGGKAYFARNWRQEKEAFSSIRDDLTHLYTLSYYPQANQNRGWRTIKVKLVGKNLEKYRLRTRDGYSLMQQAAVTSETDAASVSSPEPQ